MGIYRTAEVCPNGHVSTKAADAHPELREPFCSKCGEATITQCPGCGKGIRGDYYVEGVITIGEVYEPPAYCFGCGGAFPWTERKLSAAVELVEVGADLSEAEVAQFREALADLTKDSPRVQVASLRYKKAMEKVGGSIASGVKAIVVDVLSEAAKKAIWGA